MSMTNIKRPDIEAAIAWADAATMPPVCMSCGHIRREHAMHLEGSHFCESDGCGCDSYDGPTHVQVLAETAAHVAPVAAYALELERRVAELESSLERKIAQAKVLCWDLRKEADDVGGDLAWEKYGEACKALRELEAQENSDV